MTRQDLNRTTIYYFDVGRKDISWLYCFKMKTDIPPKRIYLVNRDFQFRYTRMGVLAGVVSTAITALVILYPLFVFKILVIPQFLPTPILAGMLAAAVINIGIIVLFGILITHRIAGPMFSIVRHLRRLANGQWQTNMQSRPGDELQLIVRNMNDLSDALVITAAKDLELVEKAFAGSPAGESATALNELRERIKSRMEHGSKRG